MGNLASRKGRLDKVVELDGRATGARSKGWQRAPVENEWKKIRWELEN
jgi:hypothetical protein